MFADELDFTDDGSEERIGDHDIHLNRTRREAEEALRRAKR